MQMALPHLLGALAAIAVSTAAIDESQAATSPGATDATQAALYEGNRLFRDDQVEAAVAAYLEGYSPRAPHPTLFYNLGTALHHLDRLPEAILWYRRAARAGDRSSGRRLGEGPSPTPDATSGLWRAGDPWLEENLWLARRSLGSQVLRPAGLPGRLASYTTSARTVAVAIAWITLLLAVARAEIPAWAVAAAAVLAISLYGGAAALDRWGPQPAVLLRDCSTSAGELPAGTEVWVRPDAAGWRISGTGYPTCPPDVVELISPGI